MKLFKNTKDSKFQLEGSLIKSSFGEVLECLSNKQIKNLHLKIKKDYLSLSVPEVNFSEDIISYLLNVEKEYSNGDFEIHKNFFEKKRKSLFFIDIDYHAKNFLHKDLNGKRLFSATLSFNYD